MAAARCPRVRWSTHNKTIFYPARHFGYTWAYYNNISAAPFLSPLDHHTVHRTRRLYANSVAHLHMYARV